MRRIADGLFQLESPGAASAYIIEGSEGLSLINTGHSRSAQALEGEIRDNGFDPRKIDRIVITRARADAAGGLSHLLRERALKVYAHAGEVDVLTGKKPPAPMRGLRGFCVEFFHEQWLSWKPVDTVIPVEAGMPIRGLSQWQTLHLPGPTKGSIGLFQPVSQILICGGVLSNRGGRLDIPHLDTVEDRAALLESVKKIAAMDVDVLCCGWGPPVRAGAFRHVEALLKTLPQAASD